MSFSANPLALSVPEPAFESWLRDTGYLEVLDQKTSDLSAAGTSADSTAATTSFPTAGIDTGVFISLFSKIWTLISLLTINPVSKLTAGDFSGETPAWTSGFIGFYDSYSFPSSSDQARMRVHENVKRYAKNYASLFVLFFACSLYVSLYLFLYVSSSSSSRSSINEYFGKWIISSQHKRRIVFFNFDKWVILVFKLVLRRSFIYRGLRVFIYRGLIVCIFSHCICSFYWPLLCFYVEVTLKCFCLCSWNSVWWQHMNLICKLKWKFGIFRTKIRISDGMP